MKQIQAKNYDFCFANAVLVQHVKHTRADHVMCVGMLQHPHSKYTLIDTFRTRVDVSSDHPEVAALAKPIGPTVKYSDDILASQLVCNLCTFTPAKHFQKPFACIHQRRRACSASVSAWTAHVLCCLSVLPAFETAPVDRANQGMCRNLLTDSISPRSRPDFA